MFNYFIKSCFFLILLIFLATPAFGAEAIAVISSLTGNAEVQKSGQPDKKRLSTGDQLFENDQVFTNENSKVSLLYSNGSVINISSKSSIKISLKDAGAKKSAVSSFFSKKVMKGLQGLFSIKKKDKVVTAVAGIRKKEDEDGKEVRVLYPRNSMILSSRPDFRWQSGSKQGNLIISITLKGMTGKLWTISSRGKELPYPEGKEDLKRGQTYFLRVQSEDDSTVYEEVYFRVIDQKKAAEINEFIKEITKLIKAAPEDGTPYFILSGFYKQNGFFHEALDALDAFEKIQPGGKYILEEKRDLYAKLGLWDEWETIKEKVDDK